MKKKKFPMNFALCLKNTNTLYRVAILPLNFHERFKPSLEQKSLRILDIYKS